MSQPSSKPAAAELKQVRPSGRGCHLRQKPLRIGGRSGRKRARTGSRTLHRRATQSRIARRSLLRTDVETGRFFLHFQACCDPTRHLRDRPAPLSSILFPPQDQWTARSPHVHHDDDKRTTDSLISKGISPGVVANMSADRRQALAERLRAKPVQDRAVFVWLMLCFAIIAMTALVSVLF